MFNYNEIFIEFIEEKSEFKWGFFPLWHPVNRLTLKNRKRAEMYQPAFSLVFFYEGNLKCFAHYRTGMETAAEVHDSKGTI